MDNEVKVFIIGGCVSRDAFNLPEGNCFEVVEYVSRTSFASLVGAPKVLPEAIRSIESNWQKRMLELDMNKRLLEKISGSNFDFILVDFLNIRFNLASDSREKFIYTVSTEFKRAQKDINLKSISRYSEKAFGWWCSGFEKFTKSVKAKGGKVIINELYWARETNGEGWEGRYSSADIDSANAELKKHYDAAKKIFPEALFINYPERLFVADLNHRWGAEPFHYTSGLYKHLLVKLSKLHFPSYVTVKHPKFGPYKLDFPISWVINPFNSKSWMHHFNSLRWLEREKRLFTVERVLRGFYNFHCVKRSRNPYYNEKRGDHAAAIRLSVFVKFMKRFSSRGLTGGEGLCKRLIKEEVKNLQSSALYRLGHNHGLLVDLALLRLVLENTEYKEEIDLGLVLERSAKTLDAMWHASGLTKEHSVSYQEYNLPLTIEYFDLLERLNLVSLASVGLKNVITESKKFLGYALKESGEYFPLGDSFRLPNENILNKVFGQGEFKSARELLMPYSEEEGVYCNKNFFIFRKTVKARKVHFAATCCWDSHNHKQNDELSFCLEVDGVTIFDDPGYTEFLPRESVKRLQSEASHSTITASRVEWGDVRFSNGKSSVLNSQHDALGFSLLMSMERYDGFKIVREIQFNGDVLTVADQVLGQNFYDLSFNRKLVLGPEVVVNSSELGTFEIEDINGRKIAELQMEEESPVVSGLQLSEIEFVLADRKLVKNTQAIVLETNPVVDNSLEKKGSFVFPILKLKLARSF